MLLISIFCVSQTLDELYKNIYQFSLSGDFKNALVIAEQAKNKSQIQYGDQSPYYAESEVTLKFTHDRGYEYSEPGYSYCLVLEKPYTFYK